MLDVFDYAVSRFYTVTAGVAAGHGYGRFDDVAAAAGTHPLCDFYLLADLYQALAFHLEFYGSHVFFVPLFYIHVVMCVVL